jgi:eukaryotic-like serine/threonine-protein kinase
MTPASGAASHFGPYRLVRLLGQGTMGAVHLAIDETQGTAVALKVLSLSAHAAGAERDEARARFLAEAEPMRRLDHPDIVRLLATGEHDGTGWLAMELVHGVDLGRYTQPARLLPEPVVLRLAERVARALHHAHCAGVVHRDVKPSNIMVDWGSDQLKLTDFGMARLADAEHTRTGLVLGSPAYMAPEQLAGDPPTPASDLYALGVTLFQLLAGRLPFDDSSLGELLRSVAFDPAPDLQRLRPDLPPALAGVVAGLLSKRPADRPADAETLADRLRALRGALHGAM